MIIHSWCLSDPKGGLTARALGGDFKSDEIKSAWHHANQVQSWFSRELEDMENRGENSAAREKEMIARGQLLLAGISYETFDRQYLSENDVPTGRNAAWDIVAEEELALSQSRSRESLTLDEA